MFDAFLEAFALRSPALDRLARIVRGADTSRCGISPQAAGLLAISMGMSRLHRDDQKLLAAGMAIYDALYEWCENGQSDAHTFIDHEQTAFVAAGGAPVSSAVPRTSMQTGLARLGRNLGFSACNCPFDARSFPVPITPLSASQPRSS